MHSKHKPTENYSDEWYEKNRESVLTKMRENYNPQVKKSYYQKNKERMKEYRRKYYQNNIENMKKRSNEWKKKNKDKVNRQNRKSWLKKFYGMTLEEYDFMYESQNGRCAICKRPSTDFPKGLHVDHNHKTNKVRGLLCQPCNHAIGNFLDNIEILKSAIHYLETTE